MSYLGTTKIGKMYLGTTEIAKAYLGDDLVFQNTPPTPPSPPVAVDYIETDGTAYINTGILGNTPMSVKLLNTVPVAPASGNSYLCGSRKDSGATRLIFCIVTSGKTAGIGYGGSIFSADIDVSASCNNGTIMQVQCSMKSNEQRFYVKQNGESSYTSKSHTNSGDMTTGRPVYLFGINQNGTAVIAASGTKIKVARIYSDATFTTIIFDGWACYYNGQYGMWDDVSNSFFGNAAESGAFTGPQI